jgi:SAM-dependent methyltransferase
MVENKDHWYDGIFYDKFIAHHQDKLFSQIKNILEEDSKVIDIGTGTGRFAFSAADKCKSILGIDLSIRNINRANKILAKNPDNKISFEHKNINEIAAEGKAHFDYAVMTYVIHEIDESERVGLLKNISTIADKIIIGDYLVPAPNEFGSLLNEIVEFIAGKEHYKNFKSYIKNNGIKGLVDASGLEIIHEIKNYPLTSHMVVLGKK